MKKVHKIRQYANKKEQMMTKCGKNSEAALPKLLVSRYWKDVTCKRCLANHPNKDK